MVLTWSVADAQPVPYTPAPTPAAPVAQAPITYRAVTLSAADAANLRAVLDSAKQGQTDSALAARAGIADPVARKIATWAIADAIPEQLSFLEMDAARRELAGFPRPAKRQAAAEKMLEISGMDANRIIQWFGGAQPQTAPGAMAARAGKDYEFLRDHPLARLFGRPRELLYRDQRPTEGWRCPDNDL